MCFGDQHKTNGRNGEAFTMLPWFESMGPGEEKMERIEWFEWDPKSKVICFLLWESPKGAIVDMWFYLMSFVILV